MRSILHSAQQQLGTWVGSSVIHLGDANVPNSLMFIDKYNQVARILCPVVTCLRGLPGIQNNSELCAWVKATYGSVEVPQLLPNFCCCFFSCSLRLFRVANWRSFVTFFVLRLMVRALITSSVLGAVSTAGSHPRGIGVPNCKPSPFTVCF